MVYSLIGKKVLKAAVKKYGQTDLLKGTGKKLLKGAANIEKKADKISEKMIKEMNSPKISDKVKGYSKLLAGSLSLGTLFPSTIDKEKSSGTNKNKKEK
tara:strand:+ start:351 stop:647 length:297 start_codon:yes stop_codon:yes gene_type:complete